MSGGRDDALEGRIDLSTYLVVSVWFGCNNDCRLCMLAGLRDRLAPVGLERFETLVHRVAAERRFRNLVLSGAEVTTCEDLDRYVRIAADTGAFEKIQIQTNGRRLADRTYLNRLVDSGVNEFFVSIQGMETSHDAVTRVPGSFRETVAGLENLDALGVSAIPNTVLTTANLHDIPSLVAFLCGTGAREIHLWNYFPMGAGDPQGLIVGLSDAVESLAGAAEAAAPSGKPLVLKSFPECLPVSPPAVFDSWFPVTVLPDAFWLQFEQNRFGQCPHRPPCTNRSCWGLSEASIRRFGEERERLTPFRAGRDQDEPPLKEHVCGDPGRPL